MAVDPLYDRLGVAPDATDAEIRRAWLMLARQHHPDAHSDPAARAAAEVEMRSINEAWAVLGDPERRRRHDERRLGVSSTVTRASEPAFVFVPFDDSEDDIDPRLLDDDGVEGTEVTRSVQMLPVLLLGGGVVGVILGMILMVGFLVAVGVAGLVLGVLSFLFAPMQAISRSIAAERRR